MKKIVLTFLLLSIPYMVSNVFAQQDLSKLSEKEREQKLIEIAMTEYRKDENKNFYRTYKSPIITKQKANATPSTPGEWGYGGKAGDIYYIIEFPYDKSKETFEWGYAAQVYIWEKTSRVMGIALGSGIRVRKQYYEK